MLGSREGRFQSRVCVCVCNRIIHCSSHILGEVLMKQLLLLIKLLRTDVQRRAHFAA